MPLSLWNIWLARNNNCDKHTTSTTSAKLTTQQAAKFTYLVAKKHTCVKKETTKSKMEIS